MHFQSLYRKYSETVTSKIKRASAQYNTSFRSDKEVLLADILIFNSRRASYIVQHMIIAPMIRQRHRFVCSRPYITQTLYNAVPLPRIQKISQTRPSAIFTLITLFSHATPSHPRRYVPCANSDKSLDK